MTSGFHLPGITLNQPQQRPAELFRADLISAMKIPDSHQLEPNSYLEIKEPWRTDWENGVQVCSAPDNMPQISYKKIVRSVGEASSGPSSVTGPSDHQRDFIRPLEYMDNENISPEEEEELGSSACYELNELDLAWLDFVNKTRKYRVLAGSNCLSESQLQKAITILERKCYKNMLQAIRTEESLRIEFDDSVVCDICRDPEREENNEMVFCDSCNVCVHQACYGVLVIPEGSWLCKPCNNHAPSPPCTLCPNRSGAMKKIKPSPGWAHVSCALWIPEVKVGNVERMEPVTNIESIPASRWNLICTVCRKKEGACIQCSYPTCLSAYHVTCGFRNGLEMRTQLAHNGVLHESYCPKHTKLRKTPSKSTSQNKSSQVESTQQKHLNETFHKYASPQDLIKGAELSPQLSTLIYNYWRLSRKSFFSRPLIPELRIDFRSQQTAINNVKYEKSILEDDETFLSIIRVRRNLEMTRNLVYMVQRRERSKRQLVVLSEEITSCELRLADEEEEKRKKESKQPLCLKRLGIVNEDLLKKPLENGLDTDNSSGNESDGTRVLRKMRLRVHSNSEDQDHTPLSPKRHCRLSENYIDGLVKVPSSANGRHPSADNCVALKQH